MDDKQPLLKKYSLKWAADFLELKAIYEQTLTDLIVKIEHIGSTSVKDLAAKPIIDIDIVYEEPTSFVSIKKHLLQLNYYHNGDQGIAGREAFKRNNHQHPVLDQIKHHLYVCHIENEELRRHLRFRARLRADANARLAYEQLKYRIAVLADQDRKTYAALKEEMARNFIETLLQSTD